MRRSDRWIIVCSTMNARGTTKIANDYLTFFRELDVEAEILSPRLSSSRVYGLIWELAGLYMLRVNRHSKLVLVNGRISPILREKKNKILLVTLDMMNYGWKALFSSDTSSRERINIMINTLVVTGSQRRATWRSVISKKTKVDLMDLDASKDLRLREPSVIYPSGSFTRVDESDWQACLGEEKEILGIEENVTSAIWITGETKNKGFIKATETLRFMSDLGTKMHIDILGIKSGRLRACYEESMNASTRIVSLFRTSLSEHDLIELYVRSNVALCLSEEEGFGLPFMDAILFGLPVIAKRIDTYVEICEIVEMEGISLPPILWIEDAMDEARDGITSTKSSDQKSMLQARKFISMQKGRINKNVREERKQNYRERATLLIRRSSQDLADLVALED